MDKGADLDQKPRERRFPIGTRDFKAFAQTCRSKGRATFFCHQNADPDAACSAIALRRLIQKTNPSIETEVVCPQGISAPTRQLIRSAGLDPPLERFSGGIGVAVLVDTNNLLQLGRELAESITQSKTPVVVIDHHHKHPDMEKLASLEIVDESSSSAAEIVTVLYKAARVKLDPKVAEALLAAVFMETRSFTLANFRTFENAAHLSQSGADPKRLPELIGATSSRAERLARLKAASRINLETVSDWMIVTTRVGSYQSSVARGIVGMGADVAIVAGKMKATTVRVSIRSTEAFHRKAGVHLARDLTIPIATRLGGSGGGHPTAAGMTVHGTVEGTLDDCMLKLKEILR